MAQLESKHCQLCGHDPLDRFEVPNQTVLWKCRHCGLFQYGPVASEASYDSPHYHTDYERQRQRKVRTALVRLNRIAALVKAKAPRLLDVGCGIGAVMEAAHQKGFFPVGSDVSQAVVEGCRQRGLECGLIVNDRLPFDTESFDVVTAWSVIEHVVDVRATLAEWRRVLRPGGILAIDTSSALCWKARLLGARYRGFWPHGHTYTFTPPTLRQFVLEAGFRVVPSPFVGRISDLPLSEACYSVAYQLQYELRQWLRLQKPFMLFAERVESAGGSKKAAA
jgi:ubiquinone/menaquinone biosynthesis C-methylase UbiE